MSARAKQLMRRAACLAALCFWHSGLRAIEAPLSVSTLELSCDQAEYWRYDWVEITVRMPQPSTALGAGPLLARIRQGGHDVAGMRGREKAVLIYDPLAKVWRGRWPIPFNPVLGDYQVELLANPASAKARKVYAGPGIDYWVRWDEKAPPQAETSFRILGRPPYDLPPGFAAMTLEPGRHGYNLFPGVDGEKPSWYRILEWARFMHADAFWHAGSLTYANNKGKQRTWEPQHLNMTRQFAAEVAARGQGPAFGSYIVLYMVGGDFAHTPYTFTTAYEKATDSLHSLRFISMGDERRKREVVAMMQELSNTAGISYIGFDYVRNDKGGLEFTDEFVRDMQLQLPEELRQSTLEQRQLWLGRELALDKWDEPLEHLWEWWKARRMAKVMKSMIDESGVSKPFFLFSLGWNMGHQHGQDCFMFNDAGIAFNAPMFYEVDEGQHNAMMREWQSYLTNPGGSFVTGQPVDDHLLRNKRQLTGPEEHFTRAMDTLSILKPRAAHLGYFWHDLNRALAGGRGPHDIREWAITGASVISRLRESDGVVPMRLEITEGKHIPLGVAFQVRVTNLTAKPLALIRLDGVWTPGVLSYSPNYIDVPKLKPFETRDIPWLASWDAREIKERYRDTAPDLRMIAVRGRAVGGNFKRPAFTFLLVGDRAAALAKGQADKNGTPEPVLEAHPASTPLTGPTPPPLAPFMSPILPNTPLLSPSTASPLGQELAP